MNRRIESRPVNTGRAISNILIEKDASEIYWLTVCPDDIGDRATLRIYDGFDAGGKLVWEGQMWRTRHFNFVPPIHCEMGIFINSDKNVEFYTIGWRPKKWDRKKPMEKDVITHPEA